jgi:ribosomal silencing factor RsfS
MTTGGLSAAHFIRKRASNFMATDIVVFKEANEKYAKPEMFVCDANEADVIRALLETLGEECNGPIENLSYTEFVEEVKTITLAELRERFVEEPDAAGEEAVKLTI